MNMKWIWIGLLLLLCIKLSSKQIKMRLSLGTDYSLPAHHGISCFFFRSQDTELDREQTWSDQFPHSPRKKRDLKCSKRKANSATWHLAALSICCYTMECLAWEVTLFCLFFMLFSSFFFFFEVDRTFYWIPPAVTSKNTSSITKVKQNQNPTTLTLFSWVYLTWFVAYCGSAGENEL